MVAKAEKDGFDIDVLLEKPDAIGNTVFGMASTTSKAIVEYILTRPNIDLRYINPHFHSPTSTFYPEFTEACFEHEIHITWIMYMVQVNLKMHSDQFL